MVSDTVKELFPHDKIRPSQLELINDIETAFEQGKTLLAHAPTGLGKTASALTVAIKEAIEKEKRVFFLTNRHTQHQIAVNTLKEMKRKTGKNITCVDLIGKRWMCNQEVAGLFSSDFNEYCKAVVEKGECEFYNNVKTKKGQSVPAQLLLKELKEAGALHTEELISLSKEKRMCGYEIATALAKDATVIIGDYYYLFNPFVQATLFNKLELAMEDVIVIVDEGHNLPTRVADMVSNALTSTMLKNAIQEAQKFHYNGMIMWLQDMNKILLDFAEFEGREKEKLVTKDQFMARVKMIHDYDELIEEMESAADEVRKKQRKSYLGGISAFLEAWQGNDEGFTRILSEKQGSHGSITMLQYSCLDPSVVTKQVFDQIHAGIVMSGTLNPTFMYKDLLGITNAMMETYPSPFPSENKLSLIVPETSTKYSMRTPSTYDRILELCEHFTTLIPGNVALFFPSYYVRDEICKGFSSQKHLLWEKQGMSKEEKERFLADFKAKKDEGAILLGVTGANFAEGVDFPGDILNGVVIIGIPLARPNLKTKQTIAYYEGKFGKGWDYGYTFPAINKCLQSSGRCIRSETDVGAVIYLDERFAWQRYYNCFPREGLIVSKSYEKFLTEFF